MTSDNGVGKLILIEVTSIDEVERMRPIDPVAAEAIAASMARDGLLHPIDVCRLPGQTRYRLVAGGHRVAGARILGWTHIAAFERSADARERKAREIAENLFKRELNPLDRAAFVAEMYANEKARAGVSADTDGRAHSANVRWQKEVKTEAADAILMIGNAYGLQAGVAAKLGLSQQTVSNDLMLFKRLPASIASRVRPLAIGSNASALRALAKMDPARQVRVVDLIADGQAKGISEAVAIIDKKAPEAPEKKRLNTFLDTFGRMTQAERKQALLMLADAITISEADGLLLALNEKHFGEDK